MFKTIIFEFGEVKPGTTYTAEFPYDETVDYIARVESDCGCTNVRNNIVKRMIVAEYTAQPIPIHLKMEGATVQNKVLIIKTEYIKKNYDGSLKQTLVITSTVKG